MHSQLHAILELRATLAIEVESLQELRREIEDYPTDFEIQTKLTKSLNEQDLLEREVKILKEQSKRLI